MKNILFVLIGIFYASAFAQNLTDHFLVTNKGDTLYGQLKYLSSNGELHNKITIKVSDTLKLTLKASEIIYFEEGMNEYYSFVPKGQSESYFMRGWILGYYELFEWQVPSSMSKSKTIEYRPLLRKKGDKDFIDLENGDWKIQLADLFKDYKELSIDIKRGIYVLNDLGSIIEQYNDWKEDMENE